jgi:16S rRNA (cytidine1402-2'-O)-methyltransferase
MTENKQKYNSDFGALYLIPNVLSDKHQDDFIPDMVRKMTHHLKHFIVENEKDARALVKKLKIETSQQEIKLWQLNEHTEAIEIENLLTALANGQDAGLLSDAGLPCIADPGSNLVKLAHQKNIKIIALPGSSSIVLTLMGSGFNGQQFTFNGYLPIDKNQRAKKIQAMEQLAIKGQTQLFMEAPYRNNQLLNDIFQNCNPQTKLCIGCEVCTDDGFIVTKTLGAWKANLPELHKRPVMFAFGI